jgi:hypothetical protein
MSAHAKDQAPPLRAHNPPLHHMAKPPKISLVELALVAAAYVFAIAAPGFVVSPGMSGAPGWRIALASGFTVVGALAGAVISFLAYLRTKNFSWLVIGIVPTITLLILAAIMAGTKAG